MSTVTFKKAKEIFVKNGIHPRYLIPITPVGANSTLEAEVHGKAPGSLGSDGLWRGLGGTVLTSGLTRDQSEKMADWPTENVGVLGMAYPGIDSDAETDKARVFIDRLVQDVLGEKFGLRLRGKSHRRLYAFKQSPDEAQVRTRHFSYKLPGENVIHKLEILGYGSQYLITGLHNNGQDHYTWDSRFPFDDDVQEIGNEDIERLIVAFKDELDRIGGELVKATGNNRALSDQDVCDMEPRLPVHELIKALQKLPNDEENFRDRNDLVSMLAAIRAVLGRDSCNTDVRDIIEDWACRDAQWCSVDYFDKIWRSLETVRVSQRAVDRILMSAGVRDHVGGYFPKDNPAPDIQKVKYRAVTEKDGLLAKVASRYVFGFSSAKYGETTVPMRDRWNVSHPFSAVRWWNLKDVKSDVELVKALRDCDDRYDATEYGLGAFLRDLHRAHPECFYEGETKTPLVARGEIISEEQPDGTKINLLNTRYMPAVQLQAKQPDKNPKRSQDDVRFIIDFGKRLFGYYFEYELDTLAYMVQTGRRPGALLFMVGDSGVGKSIWTSLQQAMFDGRGAGITAAIDGARFLSEQSRRFALAGIEGARIVPIKEMPRNSKGSDRAFMTAQLKTLVDPGPEGEYITIEQKGRDVRRIQNFARIVISSNYNNAIEVEEQDRRIFYVQTCITREEARDMHDIYGKLVDIINDTERLAAFWRYLQTRDIGKFNPTHAPPSSSAKAEQIALNADKPIKRHMLAALAWFDFSQRRMFSTAELASCMKELAEREYKNSNGAIDDRSDYSLQDPQFMAMCRTFLNKNYPKLDMQRFRSTNYRPPTIYLTASNRSRLDEFNSMDKYDLEAEIKRDFQRGVTEKHPFVNTYFHEPTNGDEK